MLWSLIFPIIAIFLYTLFKITLGIERGYLSLFVTLLIYLGEIIKNLEELTKNAKR